MPARTYAEHKADADASLPSPPVVWAVLEVLPNQEYNHEHVAAASMLFNESGSMITSGTVEVRQRRGAMGRGDQRRRFSGDRTGILARVTRRVFAVYGGKKVCDATNGGRVAIQRLWQGRGGERPRGVHGQADRA